MAGLVPREINMAAVAGLLAYGAVQRARHFLSRARELPARGAIRSSR